MRRIANYTIEDAPLAKGGMGQIFRGTDDRGNKVAVKEILPEYANDYTISARLDMEVKFLMQLDHPSIVKLYSAFRDKETQNYYVVMELVEGENIEQYVIKNGPIPEDKAVELMRQILDALQAVHNAKIVHRDLKPSNIMIRPDGTVCLLDFGVAKDLQYGGGTIVGTVIGTTGYMSPEQADGYDINQLSDIYSVGCVFYYMLTGHHAFNTLGSEFETKNAIINEKFPRLSKHKKGLSPRLQEVLDKATAKSMLNRYQSCYEFMSALGGGTMIRTGSVNEGGVKITVGREKCDIIVNDDSCKISRHHLDIKLKAFTGGRFAEITDCSSNGTMVNGKMLRKNSISVAFDGQAPDVRLAGLESGRLDWEQVKGELEKRAKAAATDDAESEKKKDDHLPAEQKDGGDIATDEAGNDWKLPEYQYADATLLLALAYVFTCFSLFSIAVGLYVGMAKMNFPDGTSCKKFKPSHCTAGYVAAAIGGVVLIAEVVIIVLGILSVA